MKKVIAIATVALLFSCGGEKEEKAKEKKEEKKEQKVEAEPEEMEKQVDYSRFDLQNQQIANYVFLEGMMGTDLYPQGLVGRGQDILKRLCVDIESQKPADLEALYALTDKATMEFNELAMRFDEKESEFETNAREITAADFDFIAKSYGFEDADLEEMLREREW